MRVLALVAAITMAVGTVLGIEARICWGQIQG